MGTSQPLSCLSVRQQLVDPRDVVGVPGERRAEHRRHADRVLIDVGLDVVGADHVLVRAAAGRSSARRRSSGRTSPTRRARRRRRRGSAGRSACRPPPAGAPPLPLQRQRAEHDRLRGALCPRARRLAGRVEEVGEHADAALLDLGRLRVLGVVDEVGVQVLGDHPLGLGLHPGGHEGGEVAQRKAVEQELLAEQAHRVDRRHAGLGQLAVRRLVEQEAVAEVGLEGGPGTAGEIGGERLLTGGRRIHDRPPGRRGCGRPGRLQRARTTASPKAGDATFMFGALNARS